MHVGYRNEEIRPVNEMKMRARWKLGRALAEVERGDPGPAGDKDAARPYFKDYIKSLGLKKQSAQEAQRLGTLPEDELEAAFAQAPENDIP